MAVPTPDDLVGGGPYARYTCGWRSLRQMFLWVAVPTPDDLLLQMMLILRPSLLKYFPIFLCPPTSPCFCLSLHAGPWWGTLKVWTGLGSLRKGGGFPQTQHHSPYSHPLRGARIPAGWLCTRTNHKNKYTLYEGSLERDVWKGVDKGGVRDCRPLWRRPQRPLCADIGV